MSRVRTACLIALGAVGIFPLIEAGLLLRDARAQAAALVPKTAVALDSINSIAKSTSDLLQATYATGGQVANLADTMNGIAQGLSNHEEAELKAAQDASSKLSVLLDHADADVLDLGAAELAAARPHIEALLDQNVSGSNPFVMKLDSNGHASIDTGTGQKTYGSCQVTLLNMGMLAE